MRTCSHLSNFLILFILGGCGLNIGNGYKYSKTSFSTVPVNMVDINTRYDDYNASSPSLGNVFPFVFSSNRTTSGKKFDFVFKMISVRFDKSSGKQTIDENANWLQYVVDENENIEDAVKLVNTLGNEFGPNLTLLEWVKVNDNFYESYNAYLFLYATDTAGHLDIMYTQNLDSSKYSDPLPVDFLNSEFDDAYPTISMAKSEIYFTSNREGSFNIYKAQLEETCGNEYCGEEFLEVFMNTDSVEIEIIESLSSASDDKCPFLFKDKMVFTSNRPGGFGGFDLYYAYYENGEWSAPINFGEKINTEYDEYRPILKEFAGFRNQMLIFSSNRPEGKGGFDLYYVGVNP